VLNISYHIIYELSDRMDFRLQHYLLHEVTFFSSVLSRYAVVIMFVS